MQALMSQKPAYHQDYKRINVVLYPNSPLEVVAEVVAWQT